MRVLLVSIAALVVSVTPLLAGDVSGQVVITRRLTKKTMVPTVYNIRGPAPFTAPSETGTFNEFERTAVMLEGGRLQLPRPSRR